MDFSNFKNLRGGPGITGLVPPNVVRVNPKSVTLGIDGIRHLSDSDSINNFYAKISYSVTDKALLFETVTDKKEGFLFKRDSNISAAMHSGLPAMFKKENVPNGTYLLHKDFPGVYIYTEDKEKVITLRERLQLNEFEEPEIGDIVHWGFRIAKMGGQTSTIATGIVEGIISNGDVKIQPISKNFIDRYPDKKVVYVARQSVFIREKYNAK
jgi:hypothetical protein